MLYALCTYSIAYQQNILWLDGVILLPLMALGIERIAGGGRPWLYMGSLALGILTDYYIGYMLCIFSVLYFLFYTLGGFAAPGARALPMLASYAGASLLAAGLAAVLLLPAFHWCWRRQWAFCGACLRREGAAGRCALPWPRCVRPTLR